MFLLSLYSLSGRNAVSFQTNNGTPARPLIDRAAAVGAVKATDKPIAIPSPVAIFHLNRLGAAVSLPTAVNADNVAFCFSLDLWGTLRIPLPINCPCSSPLGLVHYSPFDEGH